MADPPVWAPTPDDVADHLRHFLRGSDSAATLGFTGDTEPSLAGVERAIVSITADVAAAVGDVPERLHDQARAVAALGAASEAILDVAGDLAAALWERYTDRLERLQRSKTDPGGGTGLPAEGAPLVAASGRFPAPFDVSRRAF